VDPALAETIEFLRTRCRRQPALGLILGSGLGAYAGRFKDSVALPYGSIPNFPRSAVPGHAGNLVFGSLQGVSCLALQGRFHFYEGHSMRDIAFPVRILRGLGIEKLIVTNAAGGVNPDFRPGDFMLIEDHINMMGLNPLIGSNPEAASPRFPDMTEAYDPEMREIAADVARRLDIPLQKGVYVGVTGPCYETPAEIRMYRGFGADAIGMSTVPEVIAAVEAGIRVLGISCITNMAASMGQGKISHKEVLEATERVKEKAHALLNGIIKEVVRSP